MRFFPEALFYLVFLTCAHALTSDSSNEAAGPDAAFKNDVLNQHNKARAQYGAKALAWSDALYPAAMQWAQTCAFKHSDAAGKYGENLYAGSGSAATLEPAMKAWMAEASKYNYANPVYSAATGHFTQAVWKSTTQVACAKVSCPARTVLGPAGLPGTYIVCRYSPPGNVPGQFAQNVGRHV